MKNDKQILIRMPKDFCKLLEEAIKDEKAAPKMYEKLRKMAYGKTTIQTFKRIKNDEKRHKVLLEKIKIKYCPR
ncbi:unnamed protein product [marine sediment metagenome]|uniref:Rubrerythrin diiron-binding domain-containing protein n=1 Tax=marine sediment metagenome TaxID=412755 RepID=X1BTA8_9ZZZZ